MKVILQLIILNKNMDQLNQLNQDKKTIALMIKVNINLKVNNIILILLGLFLTLINSISIKLMVNIWQMKMLIMIII
jgi:hypothetical protein